MNRKSLEMGETVMKERIKKALKEAAIFVIKAIAGAFIAEIVRLIFSN